MTALDPIAQDGAGQGRAAPEFTGEHFAAEKVIGRLMRQAGLEE
jgi:hypothetical protein